MHALILFGALTLLLAGRTTMAEAAAPTAAPPPVAPTEAKPAKKSLEEVLQTPFTYRRENRLDPFRPFLTAETGPTLRVAEEEEPLSGMQLFEPGQLTLVAILRSGAQTLAMVEDSTGMGHIVRESDKIGRRGEVKSILPNTVIIEESSLTTSGTKRLTTIEMVLRKEGDKE